MSRRTKIVCRAGSGHSAMEPRSPCPSGRRFDASPSCRSHLPVGRFRWVDRGSSAPTGPYPPGRRVPQLRAGNACAFAGAGAAVVPRWPPVDEIDMCRHQGSQIVVPLLDDHCSPDARIVGTVLPPRHGTLYAPLTNQGSTMAATPTVTFLRDTRNGGSPDQATIVAAALGRLRRRCHDLARRRHLRLPPGRPRARVDGRHGADRRGRPQGCAAYRLRRRQAAGGHVDDVRQAAGRPRLRASCHRMSRSYPDAIASATCTSAATRR